jgi:hypothetical protein
MVAKTRLVELDRLGPDRLVDQPSLITEPAGPPAHRVPPPARKRPSRSVVIVSSPGDTGVLIAT